MKTTQQQRDTYRANVTPEREGSFVFDLIDDVETLEVELGKLRAMRDDILRLIDRYARERQERAARGQRVAR